jgi:hypothetical protein
LGKYAQTAIASAAQNISYQVIKNNQVDWRAVGVSTLATVGNELIKNNVDLLGGKGSFGAYAAHGVLGGYLSERRGGNFIDGMVEGAGRQIMDDAVNDPGVIFGGLFGSSVKEGPAFTEQVAARKRQGTFGNAIGSSLTEQFNSEHELNAIRERSTARAKARGESMPVIEALPVAPIITPELEASIGTLPSVASELDEFKLSFKEASKLQIENDAAAAAGIAEEFRAGDRTRAARTSAFIRQSIRNLPPAPDFMIASPTNQYSEAEIAALCRLPAFGSKEWLQTATPQELMAYQKDLMLPKAVAVDGAAEARLEYQRLTTRNSIGMSLLIGSPGAALPGQLSRLVGMNEFQVASANEFGGALAGVELAVAGIPRRGSVSLSPVSDIEIYRSGAENVALYELLKAEYRALDVNSQIGVPATRSTNPMSPVLERDALGNEIYYRKMSSRAYEEFQRTGKMPSTTETSVSPSREYAAKYRGTTIQITVKPGTSSALQEIGIATNKPAYLEFPSMSTTNGKWMFTNARFKGEGGQMTTQLGQGRALDIFNNNIVQHKRVN